MTDFSEAVRKVADLTGEKVQIEETTGLTYVDGPVDRILDALRSLGLLKVDRVTLIELGLVA